VLFTINTNIRSPFNYIGGKYKMLPQILPLFPDKISMFYDVFGGGGSVSLNVQSEYVYYNDIVHYISDMFWEVKGCDINNCINKIKEIMNEYQLSTSNKDGFLQLREDYNKGERSWEYFYLLMCYSFNNQYRFNNSQGYNSSFGMHKSYSYENVFIRFKEFANRLNEINIMFDNKDFRDIDFTDADENDLVYCDPPYLISIGNYNDGKRGFKGWSEQDDIDLYNKLDELDKQGTRFALSNVFEHKGQSNDILKEWSEKYRVIHLNKDYKNSNYRAKHKDETIEVLITNY